MQIGPFEELVDSLSRFYDDGDAVRKQLLYYRPEIEMHYSKKAKGLGLLYEREFEKFKRRVSEGRSHDVDILVCELESIC
jgi:hypothetical protein